MKKLIFLFLIIIDVMLIISTSPDKNINSDKPNIYVQTGHTDNVLSIAISSDGKYILSGSEDKTMKLWDIKTGKEIRTFSGHSETVFSVAFSPDNKYVISGSEDKTLKLWDIESGKEIKTLSGHSEAVTQVKFSHNGKYILSIANDVTVKLWDASSGKEITTFTDLFDVVVSASFSIDDKYILFGLYDNSFKIWDFTTKKEISVSSEYSNDEIVSMAFSPDGKYAVSGLSNGIIKLLNIFNSKLIRIFSGHTGSVNSLAFSPDGRYILSGSDDKTIKLWDVSCGIEMRSFNGHFDFVNSIIFSYDGKYALSGSDDKKIKMWDISSGKVIKNFYGHADWITSIAFSPDGKYIISGSDKNKLKLWDVENGKEKMTFSGHSNNIVSVVFSSDGKYALSGTFNNTLILWDIESGNEIRTFSGHSNWVNTVAFSLDNKLALSGSADNTIKLWDIETGKELRTFFEKSGCINSVAFSPDGKFILSSSYSNSINLRESETGKIIRSFIGHSNSVNSVVFSPDGKYILSGSWDRTIKLWETATSKEVRTFVGHSDSVRSVSFSPDGKYVLSGSYDSTIRLWETASGKEIKVLNGHSNWITSVSFSPDGRYVLSGSADGTVRLWNIINSEWISFLSNEDGSQWIVFTDNGYWDSSSNGGELVAMVRGIDCWNIDQFAVKNNRTDIILKKLGSNNKEQIEHYYRQYLKRLCKLNITEDKFNEDFNVPDATIVASKQKGKNMEIEFCLSDEKYRLKKYNIFVNDVPLFGSYGKEITDKKVVLKENVELTFGNNKIEISCMNENGAESFRALTYAEYDKRIKGNLYYIGFGISNYKNNIPSYIDIRDFEKNILKNTQIKEKDIKIIEEFYIHEKNIYRLKNNITKENSKKLFNLFENYTYLPIIRDLSFADDDCIDLAELFKKQNEQFDNIYIYTFTDEQVTVANIKKAKELLKKAKPDDMAILFISGHGLHDNDKDATYYFLTYETNLNDLVNTSANFDIIEEIFQGIQPRNKLFLMDTCGSGEVEDKIISDSSELLKNNKEIKTRSISYRDFIEIKGNLKKIKNPKRTYLFEMDRYIYNDLLRRSGAIVFSSCKGSEFSFEDERIENGFFTSEIINTLTNKDADKNNDNEISTDELREYVAKKVREKSKGLQNPTVDRDNIYQKFKFKLVKK